MQFICQERFRCNTLLCAAVFLLFWALPAQAQKKYLRFQHLSEEDGLSGYYISDILTDQNGFLWIGTNDGLNCYDGHLMKSWDAHPEDANALANSGITRLLLDAQNRLWIGTAFGLHRYDEEKDHFIRYPHSASSTGTPSANITALLQDSKKRLWIGTDGGLCRMDSEAPLRFKHWTMTDKRSQLKNNTIVSLAEDSSGKIWVGTFSGVYRYNEELDRFEFFDVSPNIAGNRAALIYCLLTDGKDGLWIGTGDGLRHLVPETNELTIYTPDKAEEHGMSARSISDMLYDDLGRLWIASQFSGLLLRETETSKFQSYRNNPGDRHSLPANQIYSLHKDPYGYIWAGTMITGMAYFDPQHLKMGQYRYIAGESETLPIRNVWCFTPHSNTEIWLGDDRGLIHWNSATELVKRWSPTPEQPNDIDRNRIRAILPLEGGLLLGMRTGLAFFDESRETFEFISKGEGIKPLYVRTLLQDKAGDVWVGCYGNGIFRYNHRERSTTPFQLLSKPMKTRCFFEDNRQNLWVGSHDGLIKINASRLKFSSFFTEKDIPPNSDRNHITSIRQGARESLWLGTYGGGLCYFDQENGEQRYFTKQDGLPGQTIYGLLPGSKETLWLATDDGLVHFDTENETFRTYGVAYGLQGKDHNSGAFALLPDGKFLMAGTNGLNLLAEQDLSRNVKPPATVLTNFRLNGQAVPLSTREHPTPLNLPIHRLSNLELNHQQNAFAFDFTLRSQVFSKLHRFTYMLDGFDDNWTETSRGSNSATYTNMNPGNYIFRVKGIDALGNRDLVGTALSIHIPSPPWRTWTAYFIYALIVAFLLRKYIKHQAHKLEQERRIVDQLRQVDKMRDDFLANTSHELRTPLNGIIGLAEALKENKTSALPMETQASLGLIISIGKRLATLVNDILDFSKIKESRITLARKQVEISALIDNIITLNKATMGNRPLLLLNHVPANTHVYGDEDRLSQILHNLIGNAVKFTKEGTVEVFADLLEDNIVLHIRDTGIGIDATKTETIFQSFRQADEDMTRQYGGTGLGLAISRELVSLHQGKIWVVSEPGKGSVFSFSLPRHDHGNTSIVSSLVENLSAAATFPLPATLPPLKELPPSTSPKTNTKYHILVVDDEPINCIVLQNHLSEYQITTAYDGKSCLKALEQDTSIDLVLLDIMMPIMSGHEACSRIRESRNLFELPIIFLSALNRVEDLTDSFSRGANDFLTKPISKGELLSRVRTHLALLNAYRQLEDQIHRRTTELENKNKTIIRTQNKLIMQEKMAF